MAYPAVYHNSPAVGSIRWDAFTIQYQGAAYAIAAGNTSQRFVWWRYNTGGASTVIEAGAAVPANLTGDDLVLLGNKDGTAIRILSTSLIDGDMLVDGTVMADAIAANQITGTHILAGTVDTTHLKADSVQAAQIAAGAVTASKLTVGTVTDNHVINGSFEDGFEGWQLGESNGTINLVTGVVGASGATTASLTKNASGSSNIQLFQSAAQAFPISAIAGRSWYFSMRAGAATALTSALHFRVHWFLANKTTPASTVYTAIGSGSAANVPATMTMFEGQVTPPADAKYARLSVYNVLAGSTFYVDEISANEVITSIMIGNGQVKAAAIEAVTITGDKIAANTLTGDKIAANTITANRLLLGDLTNLAADGNFLDPTRRNWSGGTVQVNTTEPNWLQVVTSASGNNDIGNGNRVQVVPGEQIYLEVEIFGLATNVGAGTPNIHMGFLNEAGVTNQWINAASTTRLAVSDTWVKIGGPVTVPAGASQAYVEIAVNFSADAVGNTYRFRRVEARRMNNGELIVNGAITGVKIDADAINGKTITGAIVQTSAGTGARVVQGAGGLIAYNSSNVPVTTISSATGAITATSVNVSGVITATSGTISGPMQVTGRIYVGAAQATGARVIVTPNGIVGFSSASTSDATGVMTTISAATGAITATGVTLSGAITATSGAITGAMQVSGRVYVGAAQTTGARVTVTPSGIVGFSSSSTSDTTGVMTTISATTGAITATGVTLTGAITATSGSITGNMGVTGILFAGGSATSGARTALTSGGLVGYDAGGVARTTVASGTGILLATNVDLTGKITASSGAITGDLQVSGSLYAGSMPAVGAGVRIQNTGITGYDASGVIKTSIDATTGKITAVDGDFTGTIRATSGEISGVLDLVGTGILRTESTGERVQFDTSGISMYTMQPVRIATVRDLLPSNASSIASAIRFSPTTGLRWIKTSSLDSSNVSSLIVASARSEGGEGDPSYERFDFTYFIGDMDIDVNGTVFVADVTSGASKIRRYTPVTTGPYNTTLSEGISFNSTDRIYSLAIGPGGDIFGAPAASSSLIRRWNSSGTLQSSWTVAYQVTGLSTDSLNNVYVSCFADKKVYKYSPTGTLLLTINTTTTKFGNGPSATRVIANDLYVNLNTELAQYSDTGILLNQWETGDVVKAGGTGPERTSGLDLAPDGFLYTWAYDSRTYQIWNRPGNSVSSLTIDPVSGRLESLDAKINGRLRAELLSVMDIQASRGSIGQQPIYQYDITNKQYVDDRTAGIWGSISRSAVQSLANGTETAIVYTTADVSAAAVSGGVVASTAGLTVPASGLYLVTVIASFAAVAATGSRIPVIRVNGATRASYGIPVVAGASGYPILALLSLNADDLVTYNLYQSSGAALNSHNQSLPGLKLARVSV